MKLLSYFLAFFLFVQTTPAWAGEEILFQDVPDWVEPVDLDETLARETSPDTIFLVVDRQVKLEDGINHSYAELAIRATTTEVLPVIASLITGVWQPDQGDFIIHRLEILRDGKIIKPLENGLKFDTLRRETNLEQQMLNGLLTATTQLEDIQVGDIVRYSSSTTRLNPALAGRAEFSGKILQQSFNTLTNQLRVVWPKSDKIQWEVSVEDHPRTLVEKNGYKDLRMAVSLDEKVENPSDAPARFRLTPFVEATAFRSWKEVSDVSHRLYPTDGVIAAGGSLDGEVAKIAAQTTDPMRRSALALQLVQDKIRYLYNGLGYGNYSPQSPEETWKLRYGDCKAKTYLLLSILHKLGVKADPALVSLSWKDGVSMRLPGFQAFDHIIVRAEIDGEALWLDGTGSGTRFDDLRDAPTFRYALPVVKGGTGLEAIDIRPIGRPFYNVNIDYDLTAGTALPALFELNAKLRSSEASSLVGYKQTLGEEEYRDKLDQMVNEYVFDGVISESDFTYDEDRSEGTLTARGIAYLDWTTRLGKKRHELWNVLDNIDLDADRTKAEWKDIPVQVSYPSYYREDATFTLPRQFLPETENFSLTGRTEMQDSIAGYTVNRKTAIEGDKLIFNESYYPSQWEIAADQVRLESKRLAAAKKKKLSLVAPKSLLEDWRQIENIRANGGMKPLATEFDKIVARQTDEKDVYEQRAKFYQKVGDYQRAADDLAKAIEIEPTASTYHWRAELLLEIDEKQAISDLEKALAIDPIHSSSVGELAYLYVVRGDHKKAGTVIETARNKGLDDDRADKLMVSVHEGEGKYKEALAILDRMIDDDPDDLSLFNERCWLRGRSNFELEKALEDCTEAVEMGRKPATYLDSRAMVYYRLGRLEDAKADLDRALRLDPEIAASHYLRALVNKAAGDTEAAENDYRAALHLYKYVERSYHRFGLKYK